MTRIFYLIRRIYRNQLKCTVDKYSLRNRENLMQPIEMQLHKKQNFFPEIFTAILKSTSNFDHLEKNDEPHS